MYAVEKVSLNIILIDLNGTGSCYKVHDKVNLCGGVGGVYTQVDPHSRLTFYQINSLS